MPDGMDYLLRPVRAGMIRMEAIHGTDLSLWDFAVANDYLDCENENERRWHDHSAKK